MILVRDIPNDLEVSGELCVCSSTAILNYHNRSTHFFGTRRAGQLRLLPFASMALET